MRLAISALLILLAASVRGAAPADPYAELPPGRYSLEVKGMMTQVCARAIEAEWRKLPAVEKAVVDFDKETAILSIRIDKTLKTAVLRKTLKRAEKLANLGAHYDIQNIRYVP